MASLGPSQATFVLPSGEVGKVFIKDTQGARADGAGCGGAEGAQASGAGGVGGAVEQLGSGNGVAAGLGKTAGAQLSHGEVGQDKDAFTVGGGRELVERCGKRGASCGVVTGLEVHVTGRGEVSSRAVVA
jgi:hypothetical protein